MMDSQDIEQDFKRNVCEQIRLLARGIDRFVVFQPFTFNDGDHFVVILRREGPGWVLTDEGHTLMHVQYEEMDLTRGTRYNVLQETLSAFSVENHDGELRLHVPQERFGDALYSFLQALNKISDLNFLSRERVHSTFMEDARAIIEGIVPEPRRYFSYHEPTLDPDEHYVVDCKINGSRRPNFVFFIPNEYKCMNATIVCHQFERWQKPFRATGLFEDLAEISGRALAQFSDVAYKQIPSLGSPERIERYFLEVLAEA